MKIKETNKQIIKKWSLNPFLFIRDIWGLTPQKPLKEYELFYKDKIKESREDYTVLGDLKLYMFEPFERGVHITWQQAIIISTLKDVVNGHISPYISIRTGHGIGKSNIMSKIVIWFLFCFYKSKSGLTAPDSQTLYDALFSEVGKSLNEIKNEQIKMMFQKTSDYLRVVGSEEDRFARCKTGKKENPEALAGLHSNNIMLVCEEASGISDEIFDSGQSNLTGNLNLFILIGNPLRNIGFFYSTFGDSEWTNLYFDGSQSPITGEYPKRMLKKYGLDSDEYKKRVLGEFPREDILDSKGYVQLLMESDIKKQEGLNLYGNRKVLGIDCAGQGKDLTTWVLRDNLGAKIIGYEKVSDQNSISEKTITLINQYGINNRDVVIDNFGSGANVAMVLASLGYVTNPIYVGERKMGKSNITEMGQKFYNLRALLYWRVKRWIESGGLIDNNPNWKELYAIRYKRNLNDEIQIMSKDEMRKQGYKSPDYADAFSLTFFDYDLNPLINQEFLNIDYSNEI